MVGAQKVTKPGEPGQILAVWSEDTAFGWLTWGVSAATNPSPPGAELVAVGLIDGSWATGRFEKRSARLHAERGRRRAAGRPKWWNVRLAWAVLIGFAFLTATLSAGASGGWTVSVAIALGIVTYNFAAIIRRASRRHVRVFADTALTATRSDLLALLSPVSAIARANRALNSTSPSAEDRQLVDSALSEALKAVWQATDPDSTRAEVDQIRGRLEVMASTIVGVLRSAEDVDSATYMPVPDGDSLDSPGVDQPHSSALRHVVSSLDESTQAIADRVSAQASAADTLRQINRPSLPPDATAGST